MGNVNAIYHNIKQNRIRKRIAKRFVLPINVFESWHTVIVVTRNACDHHSRVWSKQNAIQPAIPNSPAGEWITLPADSMRAYFAHNTWNGYWWFTSLTWSSLFPFNHIMGSVQTTPFNHIYVILMKSKVEHAKSHTIRIYTESTLPPFYRLELTVLIIN